MALGVGPITVSQNRHTRMCVNVGALIGSELGPRLLGSGRFEEHGGNNVNTARNPCVRACRRQGEFQVMMAGDLSHDISIIALSTAVFARCDQVRLYVPPLHDHASRSCHLAARSFFFDLVPPQ